MNVTPIEVRRMDAKRFDAFVGGTQSPALEFFAETISHFSNENETILGVVLRDIHDNDFVSMTLARDAARRFRMYDMELSLPTYEEAEGWLINSIKWHTGQGLTVYVQGDEKPHVDLFAEVVEHEQQHPLFQDLINSAYCVPGKAIISELMPHFVDVDGTFAKEFQSKNLDARLWELYLNAYFIEERLFIARENPSPDFVVQKYGMAAAVEAVVVGRRTKYPSRLIVDAPSQITNEELEERLRNDVPIKFGSPLYSKLQREYWTLAHIKDKSLLFAIADFHDDHSMLWTSTALIDYLYGMRHDFVIDNDGKLVVTPQKIQVHQVGEKVIPSGFFFQPNAEHVSGVLFSASGTISKFNRMGRQAGFRHPEVTITRIGMRHNPEEDAVLPLPFSYTVDETCSETWGEGLSLFHNPNARIPVQERLFPSIAHHRFHNGRIVSSLPKFHPYGSITIHQRIRR